MEQSKIEKDNLILQLETNLTDSHAKNNRLEV